LLKDTRAALPNAKLIIGEPFAVRGVRVVKDSWFPAFDAYRAISRKVADEFGAIFIPYHTLFIEAQQYAPAAYWTNDGVHPTLAGSQLMAEAWLQTIS
jgi:lysophospholipase L1-like esterase